MTTFPIYLLNILCGPPPLRKRKTTVQITNSRDVISFYAQPVAGVKLVRKLSVKRGNKIFKNKLKKVFFCQKIVVLDAHFCVFSPMEELIYIRRGKNQRPTPAYSLVSSSFFVRIYKCATEATYNDRKKTTGCCLPPKCYKLKSTDLKHTWTNHNKATKP